MFSLACHPSPLKTATTNTLPGGPHATTDKGAPARTRSSRQGRAGLQNFHTPTTVKALQEVLPPPECENIRPNWTPRATFHAQG